MTCWYCGKNETNGLDDIELSLTGEVETQDISEDSKRISYTQSIVYVPRCEECAKKHSTSRFYFLMMIAAAVLAVAAVALLIFVKEPGWLFGMLIGLLLGGAAVFFVLKITAVSGTKPENAFVRYPRINELLEKGYEFGEAPRIIIESAEQPMVQEAYEDIPEKEAKEEQIEEKEENFAFIDINEEN